MKKENEGICFECKEETKFGNLRTGYCKFCSTKCSTNSKEVKEKKKQIYLENYGVENPFQSREVKEKIKQIFLKNYGVENPSQTKEFKERNSDRMKNGGSAHASSFIKNPSKPQVELFNLVKSLHEEAILNFPTQGKSGKYYSLDIAIPSLKIDIEYDGSYFHPDQEKDRIRQEDLESLGWKFLRFRDYMPSLEELKRNLGGI